MARLVILGTAHAIPDVDHDYTHLAVIGADGVTLVDCGGSPTLRLRQAGLDMDSVTDLIATHFHPDHVSGIPLLLMGMWLSGRQTPLRIYGLHHCLERLEDMMSFYQWHNWPGFFPVAFHRLPEQENVVVLERGDHRILSSPVRHMVPTIGLRFEGLPKGQVVCYTSDTEPCPALVNLACGADVLLHESSGGGVGHSSAAQAGETALQAGVRRLLLIHYPPEAERRQGLVERARAVFAGEVELARDLMELPL
jgi:ribonuclease Z